MQKRQYVKATFLGFCVSVFLCFCSCGTIKTTGNEKADIVLDEFSSSYKPDNIFEEALENKIQDWTGFELDFSPETQEHQCQKQTT